MRYSSLITFSLGIAISSLRAQACSTQSDVKVTFYGYPDNSPPGAGTAYNCGNRNYIAGGTAPFPNICPSNPSIMHLSNISPRNRDV
jgi:hypothetical protein